MNIEDISYGKNIMRTQFNNKYVFQSLEYKSGHVFLVVQNTMIRQAIMRLDDLSSIIKTMIPNSTDENIIINRDQLITDTDYEEHIYSELSSDDSSTYQHSKISGNRQKFGK